MEGLSGLSYLDARNLYLKRFEEWKLDPAKKNPNLTSDIAKASLKLASDLMKDKEQQIRNNLSQENAKKQFNLGKALSNGISSIGRGIGNFAISTGIYKDYNPDKGIFGKDEDGNKTTDVGQIVGNIGGNIGRGLEFASQFLPQQEMADNANNKIALDTASAIGKAAIQSGNPWAALYGGALLAGQKLGINNSGSDTGNKAVDFGNSALALVPGLGLLGKKAGKYHEDAFVNSSFSYNNIGELARKNSNGRFLINGSGIKNQIDDANFKTLIASNDILQPGKRDLMSAMDERWGIAAKFDLSGGYDLTGFMRAKHGAVLQFTRRALSKSKIKKQLNGGLVSLDYINSLYEPNAHLTQQQIDARNEMWNMTQPTRDKYNEQIENPSFLQDWEPSKLSWREYWELNQSKYSNDDDSIFNAAFGGDWDLTSDYFDSFYFNLMPNAKYNDDSELLLYYKTLNDDLIRNLYRNVYRIAANYRNPGVYKQGGQVIYTTKGPEIHLTRSRTLDELVDYVEQLNPEFWKRMSGEDKNYIVNSDGSYSSLLMSWGTDDNGNAIVFPLVQYNNNNELQIFSDEEAFRRAIESNNYVVMTPDEAEEFTSHYKESEKLNHIYTNYLNYVNEFKEGGKVNVIPEGALHAHKHHLTDIDDKFEDVTTKGIPVIVESEGGEVILQAEVEKEEIIFRLEVTKKLEELSKKHTDEAAIEAGKLLVFEILHNTIDKTNNML